MVASATHIGCALPLLVLMTDLISTEPSTIVHREHAGSPPYIIVQPQAVTHVQPGMMFILSCQASGSPPPTILWYRHGQPVPANSSRISVFESGYLLLSEAQPDDGGNYQCVAVNSLGKASAMSVVVITDHKSGCSDGSTDGLYKFEQIQACRGQWKGHVKRGRQLCARGWKVCSSRDTSLLKQLKWDDVTQLIGCYALNAENSVNQCGRCHGRDTMAGVGSQCGRIHRNQRSCLAEGRVDVYRYKDRFSEGCHYHEGHVTGVVCCKNRKKHPEYNPWTWPKCSPKCDNGGTCIAYNRCDCLSGYKGAWCQHAICPGGCIPNASCIKPGVCRCKDGYTGEKCKKTRDTCFFPCQHGGRCKSGKCKCPMMHRGPYCQYKVTWQSPKKYKDVES